MDAPATSPAAPRTVTPLPAIYAFTFLNSLGTGLVTSGIYFITAQGYGFSRQDNLVLALLLGATYIAGAFLAGRIVRALRRAFPTVSTRGQLVGLMVALGALSALPLAVSRFADTPALPAWPIWVLVAVYSPLSGILWPMVESFLSGGRSGTRLRSALGWWNVVWSAALVAAYFAAAPLIKQRPAEALAALGAVHLAACACLAWFPRDPAAHAVEAHEPHPPVYERLLAVFRILLPTSYFVSSALGPILPQALERFEGLSPTVEVWVATAWLVARPITFLVLARWHAWRGSWIMPIGGAAMLVLGFAGAALASRLDTGAMGVAIQVAGLLAFGVGMATIYTGAIYYAMAVGQAEVDAGGTHEALIGVGYTVGPAVGLASTAIVSASGAAPTAFEPVLLGFITLGTLGGLALGQLIARRSGTSRASTHPTR